jgi:hypothetical protein
LDAARVHLAKADEFLAEAESAFGNGRANAAASNAVIAGINAKDAICLALVGATSKAADHSQAVSELRRAGRAGAALAPTLDRLLKTKTKAQYQSVSLSARDAEVAVRQAAKLVSEASRLLTT